VTSRPTLRTAGVKRHVTSSLWRAECDWREGSASPLHYSVCRALDPPGALPP